MDREQAELTLAIANERHFEKYCPLAQGRCREDCVAFNYGSVRPRRSGEKGNIYIVEEPYCTYFAKEGHK